VSAALGEGGIIWKIQESLKYEKEMKELQK